MERILFLSVYRESQTVFICLRKHFVRQERLHGKIKQACTINRNKQAEPYREIYWVKCGQSRHLQKMFVSWFVLVIVGFGVFPSTKRVPFSLSLLFHRNWYCNIVSSSLFENSCSNEKHLQNCLKVNTAYYVANGPFIPHAGNLFICFCLSSNASLALWLTVSQSQCDPLSGFWAALCKWASQHVSGRVGETGLCYILHLLVSTLKNQHGCSAKQLLVHFA